MGRAPLRQFGVRALHAHLEARLAELRPLVVGDVMRAVLDVSSLPCEQMLWSLEFAFDEDDGRLARIEVEFRDHGAPLFLDAPRRGYEVDLLLPKLIPKDAEAARASEHREGVRASEHAPELDRDSLVARFERALADLGAYRTIERLEALSAVAYLL